jgi:hypothetical protein
MVLSELKCFWNVGIRLIMKAGTVTSLITTSFSAVFYKCIKAVCPVVAKLVVMLEKKRFVSTGLTLL